jgi:hypothetical protein
MADTNLLKNPFRATSAEAVTMNFMRKIGTVAWLLLFAAAVGVSLSPRAAAQETGTLEFTAYVSPTAAKPEPVRQFTFYLLTKSFEEIKREIEEKNGQPDKEKFIADLKLSKELKAWIKAHDATDLTMPGLDKQITADDILHIPEFLLAYQRSNSGGVANGIPKPKYKDADKTEHPEKYEKEHQEYLTALKKFIQAEPETVAGMELELDGINPARKWSELQNSYKKKVRQQAPMQAQTKYLVAKVDTNLDGFAHLSRLPAGNYWISTIDLEAGAGDSRLVWDVPVTIQAGQTARLELTNLNSTDAAKNQ